MSMGTRTKTTTGVLFWTPAPVCSSPTSSVGSEEEWEHENDFDAQMDDNGIIGLTDAVEAAQLEDLQDLLDLEYEPDFLSPEEAEPDAGVTHLPTDDPLHSQNSHSLLVRLPKCADVCAKEQQSTSDKERRSMLSEKKDDRNDESLMSELNNEDEKNAAEIFSPHLPAGVATSHRFPSNHSHHCPSGEPAAAAAQQSDDEFCPDFTDIFVDAAAFTPANRCNMNNKSSLESNKLNSNKAKSWRISHLPIPQKPLSSSCQSMSSSSKPHESRKGSLGFRTPNFSKVEPRVRFPKGDYKPPKSRLSSKKNSLSPPLVRKSPADFVRELLVNGPCDKPDCGKPSTAETREFQSPDQATTLLEQLQDDYNNLLIKYAEAENTIDRLRLEAKVGLTYELPAPLQSVESQATNETSKFLSLCFPQAQRIDNALHPVTHNNQQVDFLENPFPGSSPASAAQNPQSQLGQELSNILCTQADKFLQQLQVFNDLLKKKQLKSVDQISGLSKLHQGLHSLEKSYLTAKNHEKSLQPFGDPVSHFDPDRELEELILQCGQHMDGLKKQVEQITPRLPKFEYPTPSSGCSGVKPTPHTKNRPETLPIDPVEPTPEILRSDDDEFRLNSIYLKPPNGYDDAVDVLSDNSLNYDVQKVLGHGEERDAHSSAAVQTELEFGREGVEAVKCSVHTHVESRHDGSLQQSVKHSVESDFKPECDTRPVGCEKMESETQSRPEFDHTDLAHTSSAQHQTRKRSPLLLEDSTSPSVYPLDGCKRTEAFKSRSCSLELAAPEGPRTHRGMRKVHSQQDGVISPETDSGFVGSESSRLHLAATSVHHQREPKRCAPVHLEVNPPEVGSSSGLPPGSSSSRRARSSTKISNRSPLYWVKRTGAPSDSSEFAMESDRSHTLSADGQSDQFPEYFIDHCVSSRSSTPVARHRHDEALKAASCNQMVDCKDMIHNLQAEVDRLRDKIKISLKHTGPITAVKSGPSLPKTSTPRLMSKTRWSDSSGEDVRLVCDESKKKSPRKHSTKTRSHSASRLKQPISVSSSEQARSTLPLQVSRFTQTFSAAPGRQTSPTVAVCSSSQTPGQDPRVSAEELDRRKGQAPPCPHCLFHLSPHFQPGGDREQAPSTSSRCHCPHCGQCQYSKSAETDCHQDRESSGHSRSRPAGSQDKERHAQTPPTFVQCVPVCPPSVLLYPNLQHVFMSPGSKTDPPSGVKVHHTFKNKSIRQTPSPGEHLEDSLDRAMRAAHRMKRTSRHIVRSLASDLQHQDLLAHSCSF